MPKVHAIKASAQVAGGPKEAAQYIAQLLRENEKLRTALGPFACLGRNELRAGDFNRARRALGLDRKE